MPPPPMQWADPRPPLPWWETYQREAVRQANLQSVAPRVDPNVLNLAYRAGLLDPGGLQALRAQSDTADWDVTDSAYKAGLINRQEWQRQRRRMQGAQVSQSAAAAQLAPAVQPAPKAAETAPVPAAPAQPAQVGSAQLTAAALQRPDLYPIFGRNAAGETYPLAHRLGPGSYASMHIPYLQMQSRGGDMDQVRQEMYPSPLEVERQTKAAERQHELDIKRFGELGEAREAIRARLRERQRELQDWRAKMEGGAAQHDSKRNAAIRDWQDKLDVIKGELENNPGDPKLETQLAVIQRRLDFYRKLPEYKGDWEGYARDTRQQKPSTTVVMTPREQALEIIERGYSPQQIVSALGQIPQTEAAHVLRELLESPRFKKDPTLRDFQSRLLTPAKIPAPTKKIEDAFRAMTPQEQADYLRIIEQAPANKAIADRLRKIMGER